MDMSDEPLRISLAAPVARKVADAASRLGTSVDEIVEQALHLYLLRAEQRQAFIDDGMKSLAHYQATGLHVTGAEVDAWIEQLEAGDYAASLPPCHS
ncbi:hypothetical protein [Rugamonas apoptosis]|uniref:Uncharacterized protein n=1 Tax=Rugamonas apoptosis TaxID=2758570 RepID=A0A7W2ILV4_9BURK|nr:hypothetical protein [Rugamonas apoptosis]MBA5689028.1 hypothetical protein [Rugamonas apoptosis]